MVQPHSTNDNGDGNDSKSPKGVQGEYCKSSNRLSGAALHLEAFIIAMSTQKEVPDTVFRQE